MGKNTITITIDETGESQSVSFNVLETEFLEGYWTKDKEGKEKFEKKNGVPQTKLGETAYFHVELQGLADGQEIQLRLGEYDYSLWFDEFDPDDYKFPEAEVVKKAIVKDNKATVELVLQESWQGLIKDDHNEWFQSNESIELYWEVSYNNKYKTQLPKDTDNYLRVAQSDRTLYFKTPTPNHNLPEFISYDGNPMFVMEFGKGFVKNKAISEGLNKLGKGAEKQIKKIAFAKMEKGYMVDNHGKVYTGKRRIHEYKKMYDNSGELFQDIKRGKDFGYKHAGKPLHTTKGISQYDYFSKNGKRVKLLGLAKSLGSVFDIFNLVKTVGEDLDTSKPLPLDFGPLSPIADLAGVLVQEQKAEDDMYLEEVAQTEVDLAKLEGIEHTREAINSWNNSKGVYWELLPVSNETANKLIQGEFKTFEELKSSADKNSTRFNNIEIIYREIYKESIEDYISIIETIFVNE